MYKKNIIISIGYFILSAFKRRKLSGRVHFKTLFLLVINLPIVTFPHDWNLRRNSEDVKVYTRDYSVSNFKEIKAEIFVKSTLAGVTKFFDDVTLFPTWIYACKTAYTLKKISETEGYVYSVIEASWPVSDRDVITHYVRTQDPITKVILITLTSVKYYIPEVKGIVRVDALCGTTKIIPLKNGIVQIIHQLHVEPGGFIPGWLANFFVTDGPLYSFQKLKKLLELEEYCNFKSDKILEP